MAQIIEAAYMAGFEPSSDNLTAEELFNEADGVYCILLERERHKLFANYSDEQIHRSRQDMIMRRIAFRGLLQKYNK